MEPLPTLTAPQKLAFLGCVNAPFGPVHFCNPLIATIQFLGLGFFLDFPFISVVGFDVRGKVLQHVGYEHAHLLLEIVRRELVADRRG
jgi:hypothetical protein